MSTPDLTADQAELEERISQGLRQSYDSDLRKMAHLLASRPYNQLLGPTEFEVRDLAHDLGAKALQTALNERKKATVFRVKPRGTISWRSDGGPQRARASSGSQGRPVRMTALAITNSLRATAVRITFAFLPRDASRSRNAFRAGLYRTADSAAR